jgi:hypothetical protein
MGRELVGMGERLVEEQCQLAQLLLGLDHEPRETIAAEFENLQCLAARLKCERMMAATLAHEVGDHVAEIDIGRGFALIAGGGRIMVMPDATDQGCWEFPALQEPAAHFGVLDTQQLTFGGQPGLFGSFE